MKSRILSASLIWDNIKRQIWIPALIILILLAFYPVNEFVMFDRWVSLQALTPEEVLKEYLLFIKHDLAINGMVIMIGAALVNGVFGFWWLHSRQKIDFYHSMPIRREKLYWNQVISGFVVYAVPETVIATLCLCVGAAQGYFSMEIVREMAKMAGMHMLFFLMIYGTTILAMMLTGRILVGVLGAVAFLIYAPLAAVLTAEYANFFFTTYAGMYTNVVFRGIKTFGSPAAWYLWIYNMNSGKREITAVDIIAAILVCAVLYLACLWIYKRRPSEGAGKSMVFKRVGKVVKVLVEIPSALGLGLVSCHMAPEGSRMVWWIVGMILGLVLSHGVMEIIYQMDFRKFFDHRLEMGIEAILAAGICCIFLLDLPGYDSYIPKQEQIASVSINREDLSRDYIAVVNEKEDGKLYVEYNQDELMKRMQLQPDDQIYQLMKNMVDNRTSFSWKNKDDIEQEISRFRIAYTLNNGRCIYRNYQIYMNEEIQSQMNCLWKREDFRTGMYPVIEGKDKFLQKIDFVNYDDNQPVYPENDAERFKILEAIEKDIQSADMNTYMETPVGKLVIGYGDDEVYRGYTAASDEILIYPGYANVLGILKEKGVKTKFPETSDVISITVSDYREAEQGQKTEPEVTEFTKTEDIARIMPYLKYYNYWSFQFEDSRLADGVSVEMKRKDHAGNEIGSYFAFAENNLPEEFRK